MRRTRYARRCLCGLGVVRVKGVIDDIPIARMLRRLAVGDVVCVRRGKGGHKVGVDGVELVLHVLARKNVLVVLFT
eukprot:10867961-Heterocapsa_arctica.AAC.1